jgi:ABC-type nitrate/sulfonate/bicarbonate transport system substrate-binding protein
LRAIIKATEYLNENKEESQDIVSERLGLDKEILVVLWDEFVFKISLDQSFILTLEDEARWAIKNELTDSKEVPNYLDYVYFEALEEIDKNKISIIN